MIFLAVTTVAGGLVYGWWVSRLWRAVLRLVDGPDVACTSSAAERWQ